MANLNPITSTLSGISLDVLVFGPDPQQAKKHPRKKSGKLAKKRIEIRAWLISLGHNADFPENLYDTKSTGALSNIAFQELAMMKEFDMIIALVDSPGSLTELGLIARDPELAQKTHVFMDSKYANGFAFHTANSVVTLKGAFDTFKYPQDLTQCHLKTMVEKTVEDLSIAKFLTA